MCLSRLKKIRIFIFIHRWLHVFLPSNKGGDASIGSIVEEKSVEGIWEVEGITINSNVERGNNNITSCGVLRTKPGTIII